MRLMRFPVCVTIIVFLGACSQVKPTPSQVVLPGAATGAAVAVPEMHPVVTIAETNTAVQPTPTEIPVTPTSTTEPYDVFKPFTETITITVVYDNYPYNPRLTTAWGYSTLVEYRDHTLLFDTGGEGQTLMENMRQLGIDPLGIDSVVLSHAHDDHTGGVTGLLNTGTMPVVYLLPSFPYYLNQQIGEFTQVNKISSGQSLAEGIWTTGAMSGAIPEQALVIETAEGVVVITGCAHPGIIEILEQVQAMFSDPIYLVMGGFHLVEKSDVELNRILEDFRRLEVKQVAPSHCTGEYAISRFADEYKEGFIPVGVGSVIQYEADLSK